MECFCAPSLFSPEKKKICKTLTILATAQAQILFRKNNWFGKLRSFLLKILNDKYSHGIFYLQFCMEIVKFHIKIYFVVITEK